MFQKDRIEKLAKVLRENDLGAFYAGPSTDIEYLAGLKLFDDERVKGLMVSAEGKCFAMTPKLYAEEMRNALGETVSYKIWADHEGFQKAFAEGCRELGLEGKRIAINDGVRAVDLLEMASSVRAEYVNGAATLSPLRRVKDAAELDLMRKASEIADAVMEDVSKFIKPGLAERDVQEFLKKRFAERGAEGLSFSPIVAAGPGGSMPHYQRDDKILADGDFVVVDMGCRYKSYCSDTTRTFHIGEPSGEQKKIYSIVLAAQEAGEAAVKTGATGQDVDRAARIIISGAGYGEYFLNRLGHGVGIAIHEEPYIIEGNVSPLQPGNVFSVEPGIYIPGKFGVRIENLVAVKPDGSAEPLNKFTKDMIIIK